MSRKTAYFSVLMILTVCASLVLPASAQHFKQVTGTLTSVSAGRNEVFGLDASSAVWRYSAATKSFGKIANASLVDVAVGGGSVSQQDAVWGVNGSGGVFEFNYATKAFVQIPGVLTQITVGVNDAWGVNSSNNVFRYDPTSGEFNSLGGNTAQIAAGGDGVWLIDTSTHIFRFDPSTQTFIQIQGNLAKISVGSGAGVFGVNAAGAVFTFVRP